jgi:hypothetical protein
VLLGDSLVFSNDDISDSDKTLFGTLMVLLIIILLLGNMMRFVSIIKRIFSRKRKPALVEGAFGPEVDDNVAIQRSVLLALTLQKYSNSKQTTQVTFNEVESEGYLENADFLTEMGRIAAPLLMSKPSNLVAKRSNVMSADLISGPGTTADLSNAKQNYGTAAYANTATTNEQVHYTGMTGLTAMSTNQMGTEMYAPTTYQPYAAPTQAMYAPTDAYATVSNEMYAPSAYQPYAAASQEMYHPTAYQPYAAPAVQQFNAHPAPAPPGPPSRPQRPVKKGGAKTEF